MDPTFAALWEGRNPHDLLQHVVDELLRRLPALEGVAVADAQGLTIASGFRGRGRPEAAAAVALLLMESSRGVFRNLGLPGDPWWVILEGSGATVVATSIAGGRDTLVALVGPEAPLGPVKAELQRTAILIAEVLERL